MSRLAAGENTKSFRSIPPRLAPAWRAVVGAVALWPDHRGLLLASAVLLKKRGPPLPQRLLLFASSPAVVRMWFVSVAVDGFGSPEGRAEATTAEPNWSVIEKMAATSPNRAVKLLSPTAPVRLEEHLAEVKAKFSLREATVSQAVNGERTRAAAAPQTVASAGASSARLPVASADVLVRILSRDVAKAAAPGPDTWTRETLLASFTPDTREVWAYIVNRIVAGRPATAEEAVLAKSCRVAGWKKENGSLRTIGITNTLAKLAWKVCLGAFLPTRTISNCMFSPGGGANAVAFVRANLAAGNGIFISDIADAFHATDRRAAISAVSNSALGKITEFLYGGPPPMCAVGTATFALERGVVPGCAGASVLFSLVSEVTVQAATFADDVASVLSNEGPLTEALSSRGFALAKSRVIGAPTDPRNVLAVSFLGAVVGETVAAAQLLHQKLSELGRMGDRILAAKVSKQARWALLGNVLSGMKWRLGNTETRIASHRAGGPSPAERADAMVWSWVLQMASATESATTPDTRRLLHAPAMVTGLGLPAFGPDHAELYATFTSTASWPPRQHDRSLDRAIRALRKAGAKTRAEADLATFKNLSWRNCHADPHDWLQIRNIHKSLRITDGAFENALRDRLFLTHPKLLLNKCDAGTPTFDHYFACVRCAGGWWGVRHNLVAAAFRDAAWGSGLQVSQAFKTIYGTGQYDKVPDLIVFDGNEKPAVIDFSIAHQSQDLTHDQARKRFTTKNVTYKDFHADTARIIPMIMTTRFTMHDTATAALQQMERKACRHGFARDATAKMKVAMINFEEFRLRQSCKHGDQERTTLASTASAPTVTLTN